MLVSVIQNRNVITNAPGSKTLQHTNVQNIRYNKCYDPDCNNHEHVYKFGHQHATKTLHKLRTP